MGGILPITYMPILICHNQWSSNCSVPCWTFGPAGNIFGGTELILTVVGSKTHTCYLNEFYDKVSKLCYNNNKIHNLHNLTNP